MNNEKIKNENLTKNIKELKEEKNKLKEQVNILKIKLDNESKKYKDLNKVLSFKNIDSKESLYKIILEKERDIKELKNKLSRYPIDLEEGEKLMILNFKSADQKIQNYSIICKNTDIFHNIEKKLYEEYKEYYDTENYFTVNGNKIHKLKNLEENKLHNNDIILLNVLDI